MKHDPERTAAAYLGGLLSGPRRRMFERHMVECEDCWREVNLGRRGRAVAESGRELSPQALRERVRSAVETIMPPRRRPRWIIGAGVVAFIAAVVATVYLVMPRQPPEIEAVLASFKAGDGLGEAASPQLPARLGDLTLSRAERGEVAGLDVLAHRYVDPSGDKVVVYVADRQWPAAAGAEHDNAGETWMAQQDDLVLICLNEPASSLVVGDDVHDVEMAAYALRP